MLAFFIKPLQRICKYPLLLREIIKYADPDDPETKRLKETESQMQQILTKINTQKRMVDTGSAAVDLQEKLTNKQIGELAFVTSLKGYEYLTIKDSVFEKNLQEIKSLNIKIRLLFIIVSP